jgi:diacylglycerol kinase family enzyme
LVNPIAGRGPRRAIINRVIARLQAASWRGHLHDTYGPGHAIEICRRIPRDHRAVVACGGDGTVRETAAGLAGSELPMAVLPAGTENLTARVMGYQADADFLCRLLFTGRAVSMDLLRAGRRIFLVVAGVGFDAEVVARLARRRRGHISYATYLIPFIQTWLGHRFPPFRVVADGKEVFTGRGLAFVGNMARYALGLRILDHARWDDGRADLCVYPCASRLALLRHALDTTRRRHLLTGRCTYGQFRHISITSDVPAAVQLDGDVAGELPLEVEVLPSHLRLLLPETQSRSPSADRPERSP